MSNLPRSPQPQFPAVGPPVISIDELRRPLSPKGRRLLEKAMRRAARGNHAEAIQGLREAVVKCPADAPYADNLLGMEFLETNQVMEAKNSYEEAARLMPNVSSNHANYALSLAIVGEMDMAEKEVRRAITLDSSNSKAQSILDLLIRHRRAKFSTPRPQ